MKTVEICDALNILSSAAEELSMSSAERTARWEAERAADERKRELARAEAKDPRCLELYAERIAAAAPEGWTAEILPGVVVYDRGGYSKETEKDAASVVLKSETAELVWRLSRVRLPDGWGLRHGAVSADGSTYYAEEAGGWRTFDRRGVDSSFHAGSLEDPVETVRAELERIEKARERGKKMISIPGFGWRVHADALPALKEKLAAGGRHTFTPAGFGTGKVVSVRRPAGRYGIEKLPAATAEFFGVPVLWAESIDCD